MYEANTTLEKLKPPLGNLRYQITCCDFIFTTNHYTIRMFNSIIIIELFYNAIFLFITTLSQDMIIVYFFIYICIFELYYLYVRTFINQNQNISEPESESKYLFKIICNFNKII